MTHDVVITAADVTDDVQVPGGTWTPRQGDRVTIRVPDGLATVNFPHVQYGTCFVPSHGVKDGTFWLERPNGGVRMMDVMNMITYGVTWGPWHKSHGWERPTNDTKAKRLAKLEEKLLRKKRAQVKRNRMDTDM
jgi:hypothetical protein